MYLWRDAIGRAEDELLALSAAVGLFLKLSTPARARNLREESEETLIVTPLGLPETLRKTLRSTNLIKTAFDKVKVATRNVKRW